MRQRRARRLRLRACCTRVRVQLHERASRCSTQTLRCLIRSDPIRLQPIRRRSRATYSYSMRSRVRAERRVQSTRRRRLALTHSARHTCRGAEERRSGRSQVRRGPRSALQRCTFSAAHSPSCPAPPRAAAAASAVASIREAVRSKLKPFDRVDAIAKRTRARTCSYSFAYAYAFEPVRVPGPHILRARSCNCTSSGSSPAS